MQKINVQKREFKEIRLGIPREKLKEEAFIDANYDEKSKKKKKERDIELEKKNPKGNIRVFGYKHPKVMKFLSFLFRCLKNCVDGKNEQLNLDMNQFLLLKNELSLAFLRNMDNILATVKTGLKLYAIKEETSKKDLE